MTATEQNQLAAQGDADATLITPRFDEMEAQEAQPVVPLAEVRAARRTWPLLLLSALLGGAVSIAGLYLYQRPRTRSLNPQTQATQPTQTDTPTPPETAQVASPLPTDAHPQAAAAPSAAVHTAAVHTPPVKPAERTRATEQKPHTAASDEPTLHTEPTAARREANAPRGERVANERPARNERPRSAPTRPTPQPQRNVDRIRDIFEGARPPA
ncbi:MAG: hypothetical protein ACJ74W_18860 [Pyrinomonadaceae bacterium]